MIPAAEALDRLREGNARFVARARGNDEASGAALKLPQEQEPFAIILGCSDARVPAEIVFDQGPGELFVIRVAGNIVAPSLVGSVEFAATTFGTRLVVVLGHSGCGAVIATLQELARPGDSQSPNLRAIVDRIRPAVEGLLASGPTSAPEAPTPELVARAVRANVVASVERLRHGSEILERLIEDEGLAIVGAEYSLETGRVEILTPLGGD